MHQYPNNHKLFRTIDNIDSEDDAMTTIAPRPLPEAKLVTLDLFSGCGGLSLGLKASGLTESRWAVENNPRAAEAYRMNFPECNVSEDDAEVWLQKLKVVSISTVLN